ncbi:pyridoxal-phosphate dependent enzyme [Streptomyces sp. NPDC005529]|uniref:pyridoxal-phosphate dependent enzyme n=1 Tax=unclassified Streptomyces TaxID=2593676 RepID=UPI0033AEBA87
MGDLYRVIVDAAQKYSIWETGIPLPAGWSTVGGIAEMESCLAEIEAQLTDVPDACGGRWIGGLGALAPDLVSYSEILKAAQIIRPFVKRTRLVPVKGAENIYVKPECEQPTGSFKVRGAVNVVASLAAHREVKHLVAHSSGNHARSIAHAAQRFSMRMTAVLPETAPAVKVDAVRDLGAEVVIVPPADRMVEAQRISVKTGARLVSSDDFEVIAGAGTVGLEIVEDLPQVAAILVPVCSGGQLAGIASALKWSQPSVRIIGVEPEVAADGAESFRIGKLTSWPVDRTYATVADGLRAPSMGRLAWAHIRRSVDGFLTVSEDEIRAAQAHLFSEMGIIAEPSGAVGLAACLTHRQQLPDGPIATVITGGNVTF